MPLVGPRANAEPTPARTEQFHKKLESAFFQDRWPPAGPDLRHGARLTVSRVQHLTRVTACSLPPRGPDFAQERRALSDRHQPGVERSATPGNRPHRATRPEGARDESWKKLVVGSGLTSDMCGIEPRYLPPLQQQQPGARVFFTVGTLN